jgi:hypothetical protein
MAESRGSLGGWAANQAYQLIMKPKAHRTAMFGVV